jgi:molecular chaperone GrpE
VELTLKSFESALDKFGIRPIYPVNEQFDPIKHEAVMTSQDPAKENNEIENIFQRGWELHERVVRPARVSVIKN